MSFRPYIWTLNGNSSISVDDKKRFEADLDERVKSPMFKIISGFASINIRKAGDKYYAHI